MFRKRKLIKFYVLNGMFTMKGRRFLIELDSVPDSRSVSLGLPDPDPLVRGTDLAPDPDPSIIKQK
jgi:hypothetical protein